MKMNRLALQEALASFGEVLADEIDRMLADAAAAPAGHVVSQEGRECASKLLGAAPSGTGARVVRALADLPAAPVSMSRLGDAAGTSAHGALVALGRIAGRMGGYADMPLAWVGTGVDQVVTLEAGVRSALRAALDLNVDLLGIQSA